MDTGTTANWSHMTTPTTEDIIEAVRKGKEILGPPPSDYEPFKPLLFHIPEPVFEDTAAIRFRCYMDYRAIMPDRRAFILNYADCGPDIKPRRKHVLRRIKRKLYRAGVLK